MSQGKERREVAPFLASHRHSLSWAPAPAGPVNACWSLGRAVSRLTPLEVARLDAVLVGRSTLAASAQTDFTPQELRLLGCAFGTAGAAVVEAWYPATCVRVRPSRRRRGTPAARRRMRS